MTDRSCEEHTGGMRILRATGRALHRAARGVLGLANLITGVPAGESTRAKRDRDRLPRDGR
ncbi:hypothetical protein CFN78_22600 [Amycolatopsis antarctica]|uniref:Uncharacterized protein n=1 Tax=Amycolatopsis antarctica TaxID=1854586 RepID=A0A263D0Q3_9PSEU|nr:hypothetical protein CFN78_22600 [Amycolatopsis antarctica]